MKLREGSLTALIRSPGEDVPQLLVVPGECGQVLALLLPHPPLGRARGREVVGVQPRPDILRGTVCTIDNIITA